MAKKTIPEHQLKRLDEMVRFIRNWRINECQTQHDFSAMADIHVNTLQKIETFKSYCSVLTLFNIIDGMGLTLDEFFKGLE